MDTNHGVILSNLRSDIPTGKLSQYIKELFDSLRIQLRREQIYVYSGNATADIYLSTETEIKTALEGLKCPNPQIQSRVQNVSFSDLPLVFKKGQKKKHQKSLTVVEDTHQGHSNVPPVNQQPCSSLRQNVTPSQPNSNISSFPETSTGNFDCVIGSYIGNEDRHHEFKAGQGSYLSSIFKRHVEKYTSGFLNSEGGALYIGVNDDGKIVGVECDNREEDNQKLNIDQIMRNFKPSLLPAMYTVNFFQVLDQNHYKKDKWKVIKLDIKQPTSLTKLYETPSGEVYMRRDGSTEQMRPHAIQDWIHQQMEVSPTGTQFNEIQRQQTELVHAIKQLQDERRRDSSGPSGREQELEILLLRNQQSHERLKVSHEQVLSQLASQKPPTSGLLSEEVNPRQGNQETNISKKTLTKSQVPDKTGSHSSERVAISKGGKGSKTSTTSNFCAIM